MNLRLFVSLCGLVLSCWLGASYLRVNPIQSSVLAEDAPSDETPLALSADEVPMERFRGNAFVNH